MKSLPYENAVSGQSALLELQKILDRFGCSQFGTMQDVETGETILQFKHRGKTVMLKASWRGYAAAWLKSHPYSPSYSRKTRTEHEQKALNQGKIAVCSILRDWIKAQITAIETGLMSFDAVFMPHILLPSGERIVDFIEREKLLLPEEATKA